MQVRDYISSNQLISANQHGFIKGRSCETALINLFSSLFSSRDEGRYSAVAALDFTKVFDTACHDILLAKLPHFGFDSTMCDFFNSYLSDRVQSVHYAGYTSEPLQVTSGVPEGSVIGPLLFVIYINDLISLPANTVMAYADDVTLVAYGQSEAEAAGALQVLLNCVNEWLTRNALLVNSDKSKWMLISPVLKRSTASTATTDTCQRSTLKFSTVPLKRVDTVRLLGVQHTDSLS